MGESRADKTEGKAFKTHLVSEKLKLLSKALFHNDQSNSTTSHEMSCSKNGISGYFSQDATNNIVLRIISKKC